jgi:hypothetical protein
VRTGRARLLRLLLYPPLAFARLGRSETPCDAFVWGANDVRPRGTGKTTIQPAPSLRIAPDGTLSEVLPTEIVFTDEAGFRPVCPFFELHGEWTEGRTRQCGPITTAVLERCGVSIADLRWRVRVANFKPFHYTQRATDRIEAVAEIAGEQTELVELRGVSPLGEPEGAQTPGPARPPLVPPDSFIPLGKVQLSKATREFPGLRLRFTPPGGYVYGPRNFEERLRDLRSRYSPAAPGNWANFSLPAERLVLDPAAAWCVYIAPGGSSSPDTNTQPPSLFAFEDVENVSERALGLVDDMCDGLIECTLPGVTAAAARVVVTPPDYAPDRRPFVSLADDLKDRVDRDDVLDRAYVGDARTRMEIHDLMERVFETVGLLNADFTNEYAGYWNENEVQASGPRARRVIRPFPQFDFIGEDPLPLTARARDRHRRFAALEVFETILREHPALLSTIVREPVSSNLYYDARMPAMMRGSDGNPLTLTRRQYQLLERWLDWLRTNVDAES